MSNIIAFDPKALAISAQESNDDLTGGVSGSFAIIGIRGRCFRIKSKGAESVVTNADGDPAGSIRVVLLKANPVLSKIHYAEAYEEGSDAAPTCFSIDGVKPDPSVATPQAKACDTCPKNVWGSKITPNGAKTKACADVRRLAVVPTGDMDNTALGGAMLFRVPPSSLAGLAEYAEKLKAAGAPYYAVSTKISFDQQASHPKPVFDFDRQLTPEEFAKAQELRNSDGTARIMQSSSDHTTPAAPAPAPAAAPAPAPVVAAPAPAPAPVAPPAPAPAPTNVTQLSPEAAPPAAAPAPAPAPAAPAAVAKPAEKKGGDTPSPADVVASLLG